MDYYVPSHYMADMPISRSRENLQEERPRRNQGAEPKDLSDILQKLTDVTDFLGEEKEEIQSDYMTGSFIIPSIANVVKSFYSQSKFSTGRSKRSVMPVELAEIKEVSEIDKTAAQRVKLLAVKFAGGETTEILARLEILNQRMLKVSPRVTAEQVESLERASTLLASIRAKREEREKRIGT